MENIHTFEYWVDQAAKGRNVADCWQNIYRIAEANTENAVEEFASTVRTLVERGNVETAMNFIREKSTPTNTDKQ